VSSIHIPEDIPVRYLERSKRGDLLVAALVVVGLGSFVAALIVDSHMAWISWVSNWLFFTSVAMGAVVFAAATTIVKARWNWSTKRVSAAFAAYLPFAFLTLLPMLSLGGSYFPWVAEMAHDPILQSKQAYLNLPFLVARNVVGAAALFGVALYFAYLVVRPDLKAMSTASGDHPGRARWRDRLGVGWIGQEEEEVRSWHRLQVISPVLVLVYAVVMSMFAIDWAMSLEPHWFSTLFGGWFFMGAFWAGIAVTAVSISRLIPLHPDFRTSMGLQQRHDLGKLAFGFTVFWTYLFWSQYIVIWYGKLPWEQAWMIRRADAPWGNMSALTIFLCFVVPFAGLLGKRAKLNPGTLSLFCSVILVGLWLERWMLVAPSLHHDGDSVFPLWYPLIACLFAGLMLASVRWFLATFPVIQVWQPPEPIEMLEPERATSLTPR
tara:strand:+ start:8237 stop:9541 length:1305 start_codon:yes stop_codon:yes gene_type:complete